MATRQIPYMGRKVSQLHYLETVEYRKSFVKIIRLYQISIFYARSSELLIRIS
jgi:hypothetical protein